MFGDRSYGFRSFVEQSNGVARALADRCGIGPGDRVAVLSQNNPEWCLTFWATVASGAVLVGLNGWWKADEILYGLQDSGATVLVADAKRFERIADRLDEAPDLAHVFLIDGGPDDFPAAAGAGAKIQRFEDLGAEPTARASPTRPSPRTTTPSSSTRRARPGSRRAPSRPTGR